MTAREQAETNAILNNSMPDTNNARAGFDAGWRSRNAEVESLTAQLHLAQATIAEVQAARGARKEEARTNPGSAGAHFEDALDAVLSRADMSALADHDRQVAERTHDEAVQVVAQFVGDNAYVIQEFGQKNAVKIVAWLLQNTTPPNPYRAATIEQEGAES